MTIGVATHLKSSIFWPRAFIYMTKLSIPNFDLEIHVSIIFLSRFHNSLTAMAPSSSKRVKNTKITRHFIIGNEAHMLPYASYPDPPPDGHTKGWKVYVR